MADYDENKKNLLYFEAPTMRALFDQMTAWQGEHQKRLMSTHIERDGDLFCCVALSNPMEIVICDPNTIYTSNPERARVYGGRLMVG